MKRVGSGWAPIVLWGGVLLGGCGEATECDDAADKLVSECELGSGASVDGTLGECKDLKKCLAKCINKSSCNKLTDPLPNSYDDCVTECHQQDYP